MPGHMTRRRSDRAAQIQQRPQEHENRPTVAGIFMPLFCNASSGLCAGVFRSWYIHTIPALNRRSGHCAASGDMLCLGHMRPAGGGLILWRFT